MVQSDDKFADIETLARIACRLAGREADEHVTFRLGAVVVFDDLMWRYPDFIDRAEAAYHVLHDGTCPTASNR